MSNNQCYLICRSSRNIQCLESDCGKKQKKGKKGNSFIVLQEYVNEDKSDTLDDVIAKMKNSLKAMKEGINNKALIDINREFTPLDLPPLSPIPFR